VICTQILHDALKFKNKIENTKHKTQNKKKKKKKKTSPLLRSLCHVSESKENERIIVSSELFISLEKNKKSIDKV
jgi:hypothetical protein